MIGLVVGFQTIGSVVVGCVGAVTVASQLGARVGIIAHRIRPVINVAVTLVRPQCGCPVDWIT